MGTKLKFLFILATILSGVLLIFSCQKNDAVNNDELLSVNEAKQYFENSAKTLKFFSYVGNGRATKANHLESSSNFNLDWENGISLKTSFGSVVEIPISTVSPVYAVLYDGFGLAELNRKRVIVKRSLIFEKNSINNETTYYMLTLCGDSKGSATNRYIYAENRDGYEGYEIYSNENGDIFKVFAYENGFKRVSNLTNEFRHPIDVNGRDLHHKGLKLYGSLGLTKAGEGGGTSGETEYHCPYCYAITPPNSPFCPNCNRFLDEEHYWDYYCSICNHLLTDCLCCHVCNWYPCLCDSNYPPSQNCPYCGWTGCTGQCLGGADPPDPPTYNQPGNVTLSIYPSGAGYAGAQYDMNSYTFTLTATANPGYTFSYWGNLSNEVVSTSNPYQIQAVVYVHLVAVFTQN